MADAVDAGTGDALDVGGGRVAGPQVGRGRCRAVELHRAVESAQLRQLKADLLVDPRDVAGDRRRGGVEGFEHVLHEGDEDHLAGERGVRRLPAHRLHEDPAGADGDDEGQGVAGGGAQRGQGGAAGLDGEVAQDDRLVGLAPLVADQRQEQVAGQPALVAAELGGVGEFLQRPELEAGQQGAEAIVDLDRAEAWGGDDPESAAVAHVGFEVVDRPLGELGDAVDDDGRVEGQGDAFEQVGCHPLDGDVGSGAGAEGLAGVHGIGEQVNAGKARRDPLSFDVGRRRHQQDLAAVPQAHRGVEDVVRGQVVLADLDRAGDVGGRLEDMPEVHLGRFAGGEGD
ncbi:MAG: hypothetical protein BWZ02_02847 [Lentisphaerae bacterium ADurb.BinA184]|nr:MAG: hypothetical protein BWZ02_02847 [Lentisphaerae bacterium ADurb.BinA184]